jgi:hypothetical protein
MVPISPSARIGEGPNRISTPPNSKTTMIASAIAPRTNHRRWRVTTASTNGTPPRSTRPAINRTGPTPLDGGQVSKQIWEKIPTIIRYAEAMSMAEASTMAAHRRPRDGSVRSTVSIDIRDIIAASRPPVVPPRPTSRMNGEHTRRGRRNRDGLSFSLLRASDYLVRP